MTEASRLIFRAEAVQRYWQRRDKVVLPRLASPATVRFLWIVLGLLIASGFIAWFAQVPVYASGLAVVVDGQGTNPSIPGEVLIVAFLPPQHRTRLSTGQPIFLRLHAEGEPLTR